MQNHTTSATSTVTFSGALLRPGMITEELLALTQPQHRRRLAPDEARRSLHRHRLRKKSTPDALAFQRMAHEELLDKVVLRDASARPRRCAAGGHGMNVTLWRIACLRGPSRN